MKMEKGGCYYGEERDRQRRNPSTTLTSSVSSESTGSRSRKTPFNSIKNPYNKVSSSNPRSNTVASSNDRKFSDARVWHASRGIGRGSLKGDSNDEEIEEDVNDSSSSNFPASLVGTCPFMCPASERIQRERLRDLAVFERLNGNPGKTSPGLAIKKFCRTISIKDVQASDMRPLPVLEDTLKYLLNLLDSSEQPFEVVHDFIFDRTRSIRQDLSMQNIVNDKAIHMYEEMVKFHVISHHKLQDCNNSSMHYLNMEQLTKTLATLFGLYEANRSFNFIYENEAEFHSLFVLLHLGSTSQATGDSLSLWFRNVRSPIIKSKEMCFARKILRFFRMCNYKRFFFTISAEASYLQYCIIGPYINEVRALAVSCINNCGYKLHPYPLAHLSKLLMMTESDLESFCKNCGLETCIDGLGKKSLPTKQTTFSPPKDGFRRFSFLGVERFDRNYQQLD